MPLARTIISIVVGSAMILGGLWVYGIMFFETGHISGWGLLGGFFPMFIGAAILWDTFRNRNTRKTND
tara:strand:+ start:218 stop:421 length:204 start_codon:yes stop_codon:yes gene_type:complete